MRPSFRVLLLAGLLLAPQRLFAQVPVDSTSRSRQIALSEALDSAGLVDRIRTLPELPTRKRAVVSISFSPSGQVDSVVVRTEDRVSPEGLPLLVEAVLAHVRTLAPDTIRRRSSIALATGKQVSLSEPEQKRPMLRNAEAVVRAVDQFGRRNKELFANGPKAASVQFVVKPDGRTEKIRLTRSSGSEAVDAEAVRIASEVFRFDPALVEGEAVPVLLAMPLTFHR